MIPKMPDEYAGEKMTACGYTISQPRRWSDKEIEWLQEMLSKGFSVKEIAASMGRTEVSVSIKAKRLSKRDDTYNAEHVLEKYELNEEFLKEVNPRTVLDLYCGKKNFYKSYNATTNDSDESIPADYNMDALRCICKLYSEGKKYDLIDLDPFGSAYDCFDLAIKMARKGLVITLGELGHKRWKRLDYVRSHYGITSLEEFTAERIIKEIQRIGLMNKKKLVVWRHREWRNIGRVWFTIEGNKITEQWKK